MSSSLVLGRSVSWAATFPCTSIRCENPVQATPTINVNAAAACVHQSVWYTVTGEPSARAHPSSSPDIVEPTNAADAQSLGACAAMR